MTWSEPARDVSTARAQAERLLAAGRLHCVWSGKRLSTNNLDIDHCFPWTVWPCGDLWNLMPSHRQVNQREKRGSASDGSTAAIRTGSDPGVVELGLPGWNGPAYR